VELEAPRNSPGFGGRECLIEGAGRVGRQVVLHDPDAGGTGIMDIDEFAHALGVVFCRPPLGDLDLAAGSMHVDADEEIGTSRSDFDADDEETAARDRDPARMGDLGAERRARGKTVTGGQ
jgi:hypothetical protein